MRVVWGVIVLVLSVVFLEYLLLPNYPFPEPPPDAVESQEEADTEDYHERRAYFTNFTRQEVMEHYQRKLTRFDLVRGLLIPVPTYRLNYPPEEAQTLIRDQTRSTGLEEIVHPFRQSFFVNLFEPVDDPQNAIGYKGIEYRQKITVRYVPSNVLIRVVLGATAIVLAALAARGFASEAVKMFGKK